MNILLTLSNKKIFSQEYSDASGISIDNQDVINEETNKNELIPSPPIVKREGKEKFDKNNLTTIKAGKYYEYPVFNSRTPPRLSMIYNDTGLCWLIAMIENFKSNDELCKYIFKNCNNENFKRGLKNVLKIHEKEISQEDFDLLVSIYTKNKPVRSSGSTASTFMMNFLRHFSLQGTSEKTEEKKSLPLFHIPIKLRESDKRVRFINVKPMPYMHIYIYQKVYIK